MRVRVTNLSRGARGFHTAEGGTAFVEPGGTTVLALADHPVHAAWVAAGEAAVSPEPDESENATSPRPSSQARRETLSRRSRDA